MRLVIIGDLHLDAQIAGRDYHADVLAKLRSIPLDGISCIVQLGDICDPDNGARTWRALDSMAAWLYSLPTTIPRISIVVGNHDRIDDVRAKSCISVLECIRGVTVRNQIGAQKLFVTHEGHVFWGLYVPWLSRAQGEVDVLADCQRELDRLAPGDSALVFCHLDIEGAVPGSESDLPRLGRQFLPNAVANDPRVDKVFAGHIHTPGKFSDKIEIVGSLECLGMGDRAVTDRGWLEVEL